MELTHKEFSIKGGKARALALSKARRQEIAAMGGNRRAEIRAANKKALDALNAKVEGKK